MNANLVCNESPGNTLRDTIGRWLPVDLRFSRSDVAVRWMDFGMASLSEPFFNMTVERLRSPPSVTRELDGDLTSLVLRASDLPPVAPAGMIAHVSRCGSTLLRSIMVPA